MVIIDLTCPLHTKQHLESAHRQKKQKTEHLQLLAEFHLSISNLCSTKEVSFLGHYLPGSVNAFKGVVSFMD